MRAFLLAVGQRLEQARADYDAYVASGEAAEPALGEHHQIVKELRRDKRSYTSVRLLDRLIQAAETILP